MKANLGELLVRLGAIDEVQLRCALGHQRRWGRPLGELLVALGFCTWRDVLRGLSAQTGLPVVDLDTVPLERELRMLLPRRVAERYRVVPLRLRGARQEVLHLAIAAPANLTDLDALAALTGRRMVPYLASDEAIDRGIQRLYDGRYASAMGPLIPLGEQTFDFDLAS